MYGPTLPRAALAAAALVTLAACGGGPSVRTGGGADPDAARGLLAAASAQGQPVPLVIDTLPPGSYPAGPPEVAATATSAVAWLGARFTAVTAEAADPNQRRLVFRFEDIPRSPAPVCSASPPRGPLPMPPPRLYAVFCDGARPVADVDGTATGPNPSAGTDLVRSVTQRMFPGQGSNYTSVPGLSLGVGIGSGGGWGSGVGVGIGF